MPFVRLALLLCLFGAPLPAQKQCFAAHDDGKLDTRVSMGGPNMLFAMRWVAPRPGAITAGEVITGKRPGANSIAIWSQDATSNRPKAVIGGTGTWTGGKLVHWQGAKLPSPVVVLANQVYWIVWGCQNSAQATKSTNTAGTVPYRASFDGGRTWNGQNSGRDPWPAQAWKFRLYCGSTTGTIVTYGAGKAGSGNIVPQSAMTSWPSVGNEVQVLLSRAAPNAVALILLGQRLNQDVGIGTLYASPLVIAASPTGGRLFGEGEAVVPVRVPDDPRLSGVMVAFQWWVLDPNATAGLAHTAGLEAKFQ